MGGDPFDRLRERDDVAVFLIDVEEVDCAARLVPVVDTLLDDNHVQSVGAAVGNRRPNAAAHAFAADDQGVDALGDEVGKERRAEEAAGRGLLQYGLARERSGLLDEIESASVSVGLLECGAAGNVAPAERRGPRRDTGFLFGKTREVDDRNTGGTRGGE